MNGFADFLYSLRKEKGLTQAALADMLGVTNKAVSKWETGEAMPETSLLVPLSEILGVTVDELLNGRRASAEPRGKEPEFPAADHLFTRGKDDKETVLDKICGIICATVMLGGIAAYLILGAFTGLWHPYWIILIACALGCGIIGIIFNLCDGEKRRKKLSEGKNPYTEGFCGFLMLSCIITYMFLGAFAELWHPCWVIIIIGAAVCGIIGATGNFIIYKNKNDGK